MRRRWVRGILGRAASRIEHYSLIRMNQNRDCGVAGHGLCSILHHPLNDIEPHVQEADCILRKLLYEIEDDVYLVTE